MPHLPACFWSSFAMSPICTPSLPFMDNEGGKTWLVWEKESSSTLDDTLEVQPKFHSTPPVLAYASITSTFHFERAKISAACTRPSFHPTGKKGAKSLATHSPSRFQRQNFQFAPSYVLSLQTFLPLSSTPLTELGSACSRLWGYFL